MTTMTENEVTNLLDTITRRLDTVEVWSKDIKKRTANKTISDNDLILQQVEIIIEREEIKLLLNKCRTANNNIRMISSF